MGVGTIRRAAPPFNKPTGVAFAPSGDLFVSDGYGNAAIHHFTRDGKLIQTWEVPGMNRDGLWYHRLTISAWMFWAAYGLGQG